MFLKYKLREVTNKMTSLKNLYIINTVLKQLILIFILSYYLAAQMSISIFNSGNPNAVI